MTQSRREILTLTLLLALPRLAWSECAAPAPICDAYSRAALVFVADVERVESVAAPSRLGIATAVRFRAIETLKGGLGQRAMLTLTPSAEEFRYIPGRRVLVYAHRAGELWSTACTRTKHLTAFDAELMAVQALAEKRPGGTIDGSVQTVELLRAGGFDDIRVTVRRDGARLGELQTDSLGRFQTAWLAPGRYLLSVDDRSGKAQGEREIVVPSTSGCISVGSIARQPPDQPGSQLGSQPGTSANRQ